MILPNLIGPLTEPIDGDEYVRVVLTQRQRAWIEAHGSREDFPPLLEWFITAEDEKFVMLPTVERPPARVPQPRRYRSAASLREEHATLLARMERVAGRSDLGDRAAANLSPHARSRAARSAGHRRFEQMDRDLRTYARLRERAEALAGRIARAEAREASNGVH